LEERIVIDYKEKLELERSDRLNIKCTLWA